MKFDEKNIEEILKRHLPSPSQEETVADCNRVWSSLQSRAVYRVQQEGVTDSELLFRRMWHRAALISATAAVLLAAFIGTIVWQRGEPVAVVEHVEDSLSRVVEGQSQPLAVHDTLEVGDTVRTSGVPGAVFSLVDG